MVADGNTTFWRRHSDKESRWQCPCGYTGTFGVVSSHRKGWKNRPACDGRIFAVTGPDAPAGQSPPARDTPAPAAPAERAAPAENAAPTGAGVAWEYDPGALADGLDAEEINRIINLGRADATTDDGMAFAFGASDAGDPGNGTVPPLDGDGAGAEDLPPGDWRLVPAGPNPQVSQAREAVTLPAVVRVMYDYAVSHEGWRQGDGTLSAFIWDVVIDHWKHCWCKAVVVIDRWEGEGG